MKVLTFHSDQQQVVVYIKGMPIALHGEVDVTVKQPSKMTAGNRSAWAIATQESVNAISLSNQKE